jgi:nucleotide-binding universal stress UspA family protein/nitroreductase
MRAARTKDKIMPLFHKILCPTDFSEPSYYALQKAMALAQHNNAELCLLHVVPRGELAPGQADTAEAQRHLEDLIRDYAPPQLQVRAIVRDGNATDEILNTVQDEGIDLIVMATHGATGWREFALGSVMDEVVRLAPCPVFTISSIARQKPDADSAVPIPASVEATTMKMNNFDAPEQSAPEYSRDADFPLGGSPEAKLRFLLSYAILAPSNRNSQPWRWHLCGDTVELHADRMRALPHLDPDDRELTLSCGAALLHLRIAMRHFGYTEEVKILPDRGDPNLLAVVRLGEEYSPSPDDDRLFEAIPARHTNRHPFLERELPADLQQLLQSEAEQEGAWLFFVEDVEARMEIINLIARSDHEQGRDPQFLQETASWIRPNRSPSDDGIPQYAWGGGGLASRYTTDTGAAMGDKDRLLAWSAPVLAILETADDTPRDWLAAGQALARVLLRAAAEGVQASFFNSPIEVVQMWTPLHHILQRTGLPQMILRLGYPAQETGATPRRTVDEVVS